jgi:hypothetical protein
MKPLWVFSMLGIVSPPPPTIDPYTYYAEIAVRVFLPSAQAWMAQGYSAMQAKLGIRQAMIDEGFPASMADAASAELGNWLVVGPDLARIQPLFPSWMTDTEKQQVRTLAVGIGGSAGMYGVPAMDALVAAIDQLTTADYVRRGGGTLPRMAPIGNKSAEYFFHPLLRRAAARVYGASVPLRGVLDSIPWPHPWIKDFVLATDPVNFPTGGPLYNEIPLWDFYGLMEAGYFQTPRAKIERDVARWLISNSNTMNLYFQKRSEQWIRQQEGKALEGVGPAAMALVKGVLFIGGIAAMFMLPALGQIIVDVLQKGWGLFATYSAGQDQLSILKAAGQSLVVSPSVIKDFGLWVSEKTLRPEVKAPAHADALAEKKSNLAWLAIVPLVVGVIK